MEIFCHGRSEVASRSSQPYWYYWDAGFNNTAGSFTRIHSIAVVPKDGQPDPGLPPPITAPVNNPNFKPISPTPESPPEKKLGTSIAPSINPTISPSPTPEAVISSNPGATVAPPIAPPPEPYNPQAPDDPPTTDDPKNQNKLPFSGTPLLIPPFAALAPPSNKSTPIKNGAGTGAANAPSSEDTTTYQTPVDECRGSCADKAKGGGLSPESISNLGNTLNDLLLQNPLLLKIDNTTTTAKSFLQTAWQTTRIDKILNYLSLLATLHNAAMLSRNLGASLGDVFSSIANNTISFIKNEESNDIDINATLGNTIENFLKGLLGEENYNNTSETFSRYNRIINAASNIIYSIQSVQAGLTEGLETVGSYTGKIGNALKKSGAVLESSYNWMSDKFSFKSGRLATLQRVIDGGEQIENVASEIANATSEFREAQQSVTEIGNSWNSIQTEVGGKESEKATAESTTKTNSQGSQPVQTDLTPDL
jgi:hypothetical protein